MSIRQLLLDLMCLSALGPSGAIGIDGKGASHTTPVTVALQADRAHRVERRLRFDSAGAVTFSVRIKGPAARYGIRNASGQSLVPADPVRYQVTDVERLERFSLPALPSDGIEVDLIADELFPATLDVQIEWNDGYVLQPTVKPTIWAIGQQALLSAVLLHDGEPVSGDGTHIAVIITAPQGAKHEVPLVDDGQHGDGAAGDGHAARAIKLTSPGMHHLQFVGKCQSDEGTVERRLNTFFHVLPEDGPKFTGAPTMSTPDRDQDGLIDALIVQLPVRYSKGSRISLFTRLVDTQGNIVHPGVWQMAMNVGDEQKHVKKLVLHGPDIARARSDGPWVLQDTRLWDVSNNRLADVIGAVKIPHLKSEMFEPPAAPVIAIVSRVDTAPETISIQGRNVGDASTVLIAGHMCPFVVEALGSTLVSRSADLTSEEWEQLLSQLQNVPVEVGTPWGRAIYP